MHGGTVRAESAGAGRCASFTVSLPPAVSRPPWTSQGCTFVIRIRPRRRPRRLR
ncbi:MAG TPA: hypothetical protein VEK57_04490 [Thermoanaerobaculia bacterium]|nr:hypothetical protein [Thermoanaerobaculia bacterium]